MEDNLLQATPEEGYADFRGTENNGKKPMSRTQKRNLFFGLMIIIPVLIFIVFYVIVNFNTLLLAFKKYTSSTEHVGYDTTFAGFDNFKRILFSKDSFFAYEFDGEYQNLKMIRNSLILWGCKIVIGLPLAFIFSYYVYKKRWASGFFRIILFLPNVISNIIMVSMFKFFMDYALIEILGLEVGYFIADKNPAVALPTIIFFNLWLGFAEQTLLFTSSMSGINESVVESAQLDGVTNLQEMWYITLPMIYSTFTTFIIVGIATIFTDQMSLVAIYGLDISLTPTDLRTIGFYLFQQAYEADYISSWNQAAPYGKLSYSELSAFGLLISIVIIPVSMGAKKLLEKVGPSFE